MMPLRNIKILTNMQIFFFEILVPTALIVGLIWTILELTPKSTLLSLTILYSILISSQDRKTNLLVHFLKEVMAGTFAFEIY